MDEVRNDVALIATHLVESLFISHLPARLGQKNLFLKGIALSKSPNKTGGPVVKSGPTRGKNRSRNEDGRWRAKRSDAGKTRDKKKLDKKEKSGCFLTTAASQYKGLPDDCYELTLMREFRDSELMTSASGQALVAEYYNRAPGLVPLLEDCLIADRVWEQICLIVKLIEDKRPAAAIESYEAMVLLLEQEAA